MSDDVIFVFNKDALEWPTYISDILDKTHLKIASRLDTEVFSRPTASPLALVHIVIVTPGHVEELKEHKNYTYQNTVKDPTKGVLFLCGVQLIEFEELDGSKEPLSKRFPELKKWNVVDYNNAQSMRELVAKLVAKPPAVEPKAKPPISGVGKTPVSSPTWPKTSVTSPTRSAPNSIVAEVRKIPTKTSTIKIYPTTLRSEEPTIVTISFNEPIQQQAKSEDTKVAVIISSVDHEDSRTILLPAAWVNPYTCTFTAPEHREGDVTVKVMLNGTEVGKDHTLKYVSQSGLITDIAQIYLHQLCNLCDLMLTKKNVTITELDNCLTDIFNLDNGMADIPGQAFEMLFGILKHMKDEKVDSKSPTLIHFAAKYGLQELCCKLTDLPDAALANALANSDGKLPEDLAKANKHLQLALFLESNREIDQELENVYVQYCGYINSEARQMFDKHGYLRAQDPDDSSEAGYMTMGAKQVHRTASGKEEKIYTCVLEEDEGEDTYDYTSVRGPTPHRKTIIPIPGATATTRTSTGTQQQRKDSDASTPKLGLSTSQAKLVEIMEMVKRKELTVSDAELMFKQWQMEYKGGAQSKSFKEKQQQLEKMREEVNRAKTQTNVHGALGAAAKLGSQVPGPTPEVATGNQRSSSTSTDSRDSRGSMSSRTSRNSTSGIETDEEPTEPIRPPIRQPLVSTRGKPVANPTPAAPALPPPRTKK